MNDLRSRSRGLAAVPDESSVPTSTPPRDRRETEDQNGRRMSRRQSIAERAKQAASADDSADDVVLRPEDDPMFTSSRPVKGKTADGDSDAPAATGSAKKGKPAKKGSRVEEDPDGPSSRPNRRREVAEIPEEGDDAEDRFPWHFQYDDEEPEELQASSPLLSRAFRATTG